VLDPWPRRLRPLSERECYLRLYGERSGTIEPCSRAVPKIPARTRVPADGPSDERPALHLVIAYPRGAGTMTGEQLRLDLLRRMQRRAGRAA
jgi:hypothetical protein